jgi:uncharacterized radical SAM superfamily Fe-S cluster-containing enzyme
MVTEGEAEIIQISGGEPSIHPEILEIIATASARGIRYVMLNTNGIRLAEEPDFVSQLAAYRPTIYLQFDGVSGQTYQTLRGRDLRIVKQKALNNLAEAGLYAILVATIVQGVNDNEIGDILRCGLCWALPAPSRSPSPDYSAERASRLGRANRRPLSRQ